jgi:hypothetical protein
MAPLAAPQQQQLPQPAAPAAGASADCKFPNAVEVAPDERYVRTEVKLGAGTYKVGVRAC